MKHLTDYIRQLQAHGEIYFTSEQAMKALGVSRQALNISLGRSREKLAISTVVKNFHVIVSPEYQILGCLPPSYFIDFLMQYWQIDYYVCLLSAAECHGAAHQKPQVYQVMVPKRIKSIRCGKIAIDFIYKKNLENLPVIDFGGATGYYKVSSPELTAMDLFSYPNRVGGINRIGTILAELVESFEAERLLALAQLTKQLNWTQRLGFILEHGIESAAKSTQAECILALKKYLQQKPTRYTPLTRGKTNNMPINTDWHIIINAAIEGDL